MAEPRVVDVENSTDDDEERSGSGDESVRGERTEIRIVTSPVQRQRKRKREESADVSEAGDEGEESETHQRTQP